MRNVGKIKYEMFLLDLKIKDKRTRRKLIFQLILLHLIAFKKNNSY